jgi:hypothetical protein
MGHPQIQRQIQKQRQSQRQKQNHEKQPQDELAEWYYQQDGEINRSKYSRERPDHPPVQVRCWGP